MSAAQSDWVTFDCFGTLVDWDRGFAAILHPLFGAQTPAVVRAYHEFEPQVEAERPHRLYKQVLATALGKAAGRVGLAFSESRGAALAGAWASLPIFADVEPALAALRAAGCKLGVLTNCDEDLFAQTQRGFQSRFDLVITAEQVRDYKPAPAHFRSFAARSGANPARWVHVACSWFHDIAPARELGLKRIWLDRTLSGEDPSAASERITSAVELPAAVRRLLSHPA